MKTLLKIASILVITALASPAWAGRLRVHPPITADGRYVKVDLLMPGQESDSAMVKIVQAIPTPNCKAWQAPANWNILWNDADIDMFLAVEATDDRPDIPSSGPTGKAASTLQLVRYAGPMPQPTEQGFTLRVMGASDGQPRFVKSKDVLEELWMRKLAGIVLGEQGVDGWSTVGDINQRHMAQVYAACKLKMQLFRRRQYNADAQINAQIIEQSLGQVKLAVEIVNGLTLIVPGLNLVTAAGMGMRNALFRGALAAFAEAEAITVVPGRIPGLVHLISNTGAVRMMGTQDALRLGLLLQTPVRLPSGAVMKGLGEVMIGTENSSVLGRFLHGQGQFVGAQGLAEGAELQGCHSLKEFLARVPKSRLAPVEEAPGVVAEFGSTSLPGIRIYNYRVGSAVKQHVVYNPEVISSGSMSEMVGDAVMLALKSGKSGRIPVKALCKANGREYPFEVVFDGGRRQVVSVELALEPGIARIASRAVAASPRPIAWEVNGELGRLLGVGDMAAAGPSGRLGELLSRAGSPQLAKQMLSKSDTELVQMAAQLIEKDGVVGAIYRLIDLAADHPGYAQLFDRLRYIVAKAGSQDPLLAGEAMITKTIRETGGPLAGAVGSLNFWSATITATAKLELPELFSAMLRADALSKAEAVTLVRQIGKANGLRTPAEALERVRVPLLLAERSGTRVAGLDMLFEKGVLNEKSRRQVLALTAKDL